MPGKRTGAGKLLASSALYWYPRIRNLGIDVPRTRFVDVPPDYMAILVGDQDIKIETQNAWSTTITKIKRSAVALGGYPVFLRTDLASAKHEGPKSYRINDATQIAHAMSATLEDNEMKWLNPAAFMVRRWLDLDAPFNAFGGHPIAREWRFFVTKSRVICRNFYWPEDSIEFFGIPEPPRWREILEDMTAEPPPNTLNALARRAAGACPEAQVWSVDFAMTREREWFLIDMAVGEESAHPWDGCQIPNNQKARQDRENHTRGLDLLEKP